MLHSLLVLVSVDTWTGYWRIGAALKELSQKLVQMYTSYSDQH